MWAGGQMRNFYPPLNFIISLTLLYNIIWVKNPHREKYLEGYTLED